MLFVMDAANGEVKQHDGCRCSVYRLLRLVSSGTARQSLHAGRFLRVSVQIPSECLFADPCVSIHTVMSMLDETNKQIVLDSGKSSLQLIFGCKRQGEGASVTVGETLLSEASDVLFPIEPFTLCVFLTKKLESSNGVAFLNSLISGLSKTTDVLCWAAVVGGRVAMYGDKIAFVLTRECTSARKHDSQDTDAARADSTDVSSSCKKLSTAVSYR